MKKETIIDFVSYLIWIGLIKLTSLSVGFENTVLITFAYIISNQIKGDNK